MNDIDYNEINNGYRNLVIYLVIILIVFAILMYYLSYLYITGSAQMFNLTNSSWDYIHTNTTAILTPVRLGGV